MYIRISRVHCDPSKWDELLAAAEEVSPAVRQLPGCQSSYWGVDRASGLGVAVSTWDTREQAGFSRDALVQSAGSASRNALALLQASGGQMDPPEIYEISVGQP